MTEIGEQKNAACHAARTVHTIGHSTRSSEAFIELLNAHAIETLVDVRRWPGSRRHPQFNREALSASLKSNGIEYLWRGDLGGFRKPASDSPNNAWRVSAFRAYADFMLTDEFERSESWFYLFVVVAAGFVPWILLLPSVLQDSWKRLDDKNIFGQNRLIFTICDEYGRAVGFGSRALEYDKLAPSVGLLWISGF